MFWHKYNANIIMNGNKPMNDCNWIICPICGRKTHDKIREDTELKNFPLYCPKCKQESLINAKDLQVTVVKEPDA